MRSKGEPRKRCPSDGGPKVRIHLPPAASQVRTRAGVQALILILDNHEFFRQVGVALTTVIPRKRTGLIAAIVGWAVALALTGCSQLVAPGSQAPVIDSHTATSISSPQTDGQVPVGGASLSSRDVVRAGGFPRSFLIPGTETSIRIGGS
jgi:hypothetical protein